MPAASTIWRSWPTGCPPWAIPGATRWRAWASSPCGGAFWMYIPPPRTTPVRGGILGSGRGFHGAVRRIQPAPGGQAGPGGIPAGERGPAHPGRTGPVGAHPGPAAPPRAIPTLTTAAHHLPPGSVVCFSESGRVAERAKTWLWQLGEDVKTLVEQELLDGRHAVFAAGLEELIALLADEHALCFFDSFATSSTPLPPRALLAVQGRQLSTFGVNLETGGRRPHPVPAVRRGHGGSGGQRTAGAEPSGPAPGAQNPLRRGLPAP